MITFLIAFLTGLVCIKLGFWWATKHYKLSFLLTYSKELQQKVTEAQESRLNDYCIYIDALYNIAYRFRDQFQDSEPLDNLNRELANVLVQMDEKQIPADDKHRLFVIETLKKHAVPAPVVPTPEPEPPVEFSLDQVLEKISQQGMASLTPQEQLFLQSYSQDK